MSVSKRSVTIGRIIGHEDRVYILQQLAEATQSGEVGRSPRVIAEALDRPLGNVSYHMRILLAKQAVRLVREIPRRGSVEHVYTLTPFGSDALRVVEIFTAERTNAR